MGGGTAWYSGRGLDHQVWLVSPPHHLQPGSL